jgi:hypothetical protein
MDIHVSIKDIFLTNSLIVIMLSAVLSNAYLAMEDRGR